MMMTCKVLKHIGDVLSFFLFFTNINKFCFDGFMPLIWMTTTLLIPRHGFCVNIFTWLEDKDPTSAITGNSFSQCQLPALLHLLYLKRAYWQSSISSYYLWRNEELIFISICVSMDQYFSSCSDKTKFLSLCENIKFFLCWWIFAFFHLLL
jgi:hypothetical protein